MAHRQEEKERRRLERLEQEKRERRAAARRRRLQMVVGGVLAALLVAGIALGVGLGGGGDDEEDVARRPANVAGVKLPEPRETNFEQAAKAAGCELEHPPIEGGGHETREFKPADYSTNPPTSGTHNPDWYEDGIYEPGNVPELGKLVHTLEHGRINIQYKPGTPAEAVRQLEAFYAEKSEYHMLLYENTTGMKHAVAATAWGHLLGCPTMNDRVFDALRTFYDRYVDKGPEQVP